MSLLEEARPSLVEIRESREGYSLYRDGKPFYVKGAGGFGHVQRLEGCGGNSIRTWGTDQTLAALPEIRKSGMTLCAGLWLDPPRRGFRYDDEVAVSRQAERLKSEVNLLKDEPSLLLWSVGNELELGGRSEGVWRAVEDVARYIKSVDTMHPVLTVLASPDEGALRAIERQCPSVDLVGINSYGDLPKIAPTLASIGWKRPYLVTEWGSDGSWEVAQTEWGAEIEPTSTEKASQLRARYELLWQSKGACLGSYAFLWGHKQETTATWFGLFDPEGRSYEGVETLESCWKGGYAGPQTPRVSALRLQGKLGEESCRTRAGEGLHARYELLWGRRDRVAVKWALARESADKGVGGDAEEAPEPVKVTFRTEGLEEVRFAAPKQGGAYRLYLYVYGENRTAATANIPFWVE